MYSNSNDSKTTASMTKKKKKKQQKTNMYVHDLCNWEGPILIVDRIRKISPTSCICLSVGLDELVIEKMSFLQNRSPYARFSRLCKRPKYALYVESDHHCLALPH